VLRELVAKTLRAGSARNAIRKVTVMSQVETVPLSRERRKARRYDVEVEATITVDGPAGEKHCTIHDISQTGAFIEVPEGEMPDDFTLTFSRRCRVVRRTGDGKKIGVQFLLPWSAVS
jgi:hypothetical protein